MRIGGGISCDGVKIEETGKKYYDFVVQFIDIGRMDPSSRRRTWRIKTKVLFIARCSGSESAESLRGLVDNSLKVYNTCVDHLRDRFTFVIDFAATMAATFGSSVSPNRVPFSERWVGCIPH